MKNIRHFQIYYLIVINGFRTKYSFTTNVWVEFEVCVCIPELYNQRYEINTNIFPPETVALLKRHGITHMEQLTTAEIKKLEPLLEEIDPGFKNQIEGWRPFKSENIVRDRLREIFNAQSGTQIELKDKTI